MRRLSEEDRDCPARNVSKETSTFAELGSSGKRTVEAGALDVAQHGGSRADKGVEQLEGRRQTQPGNVLGGRGSPPRQVTVRFPVDKEEHARREQDQNWLGQTARTDGLHRKSEQKGHEATKERQPGAKGDP